MGIQKKEVKRAPRKKTKQRSLSHGVLHVLAKFNNTIVTVTDSLGKVLASSSSGAAGFKGSRKGTPYAAQVAANMVGDRAKEFGIKSFDVMVKGPGPGREAAVRTIHNMGFDVKSLKDVTPLPHNGVRRRKKRRV